jgi:hypothetical protein
VEPTAMQNELFTHEIEFNVSLLVPALGLDISCHSEPFHFIARVSMTSVPSSVDPTAMQFDALTHETDDSRSLAVPALGLETMVAVSTTAPAEVETTTAPKTTAIAAATTRTDLRTITRSKQESNGEVPIRCQMVPHRSLQSGTKPDISTLTQISTANNP